MNNMIISSKNIIKAIVFFFTIFFFIMDIFPNTSYQVINGYNIVLNNDKEKETKPGSSLSKIDNLNAPRSEELSTVKTLTLDLFLPGGGHFYRGDHISGIIFMSLKIAGAYSMYHFYRRWDRAGDRYDSARNSGQSAETIESLKKSHDRDAQYITFASISNVLLYTISAIINFNMVNKKNEKSYPSFDVHFPLGGKLQGEGLITMQYNFRYR